MPHLEAIDILAVLLEQCLALANQLLVGPVLQQKELAVAQTDSNAKEQTELAAGCPDRGLPRRWLRRSAASLSNVGMVFGFGIGWAPHNTAFGSHRGLQCRTCTPHAIANDDLKKLAARLPPKATRTQATSLSLQEHRQRVV
jgi:hypothetical protein